jgi:hypothetical protein
LFKKLQNTGILQQSDVQLLDWYATYSAIYIGSEKIKTCNGVAQGSVISPILFDLVMSDFLNELSKMGIMVLAFADDIIAIVNNQNQIDKLIYMLEKIKLTLNLSWNQSKTEAIVGNWKNIDLRGIRQVNSYKYLGIPIYNEMRSIEHQNDVKSRIKKLIGLFSIKLSNLNHHIQRIMMCSYVRSIYEYSLPPLILSGDIRFIDAVKWERTAIKKVLSFPLNSTEEALIKILGTNPAYWMYKRITLIYQRMKILIPTTIMTILLPTIEKNISKITNDYKACTVNEEYLKMEKFIKAKYEINNKKIVGGVMFKKIFRMCSKYLPKPKKMNAILFKSIWIKAKTNDRMMCKQCHAIWSKEHISKCPLIVKYGKVINDWRQNGMMRIELYTNINQIRYEAQQLKEAYHTIINNTYLVKGG